MSDVALSTPLTRIQAELDDPNAQRYDDAYIMRFVDQSNEDLLIEFASKGIEYGEQVAMITALPVNTANLNSYQVAGGALEFMILPIAIDWKDTGQPDTNYTSVQRVDKLSDVQSVDGIVNYEFRSGTIRLTPSTGILDLRIRFFGMPSSSLSTQQSTVTRAAVNIFVYKVAQKIASRNGNEQLATDLKEDLWKAQENFEELMVKQDQQVIRRFGRMNQSGGSSGPKIPTI